MGRSQSGQQQQWPALASHKHRCNTAAYRMHRSTRECAKRLRCSYVSNAPSFKAPVFCTVALPQVHRFVCDNSTAAREALQLFTHCLACRKFYDRLKELREYHKRFPVYDISVAEDDTALLKEEPQVEFSGEETLGRYVLVFASMHMPHQKQVCVFLVWCLGHLYTTSLLPRMTALVQ
eukprot:GHRR01025085.1.p1 GENE.GHRR01025085.1~~GHRR01025085.1.p1  ORF type:complete len:178 (-),score=45.34 GHRR01025085.1:701-1234(-)